MAKKKVSSTNSEPQGKHLPAIKKGDALPAGAEMGPSPGAGINPSGRILDANGKIVGYYHIPSTTQPANDLPTATPPASGTSTAQPQTGTTATPATPAKTTIKPPPIPEVKPISREAQRKAFNDALTSWDHATAQKVPSNIAKEIESNIRPNVQNKQKILDAALKAKYGKSYDPLTGPKIGQSLSYDEAAKAVGGKDQYDNFLNDIYSYENYRKKTFGTYDTQSITQGATDPNEKMYGTRMSNLFKVTQEQAAANTKKTPQAVLDYQKNPDMYTPSGATSKAMENPYMIDGNNKKIPVLKNGLDGKPIIDAMTKDVPQMKSGGMVKRKGYADGNVVLPNLSTLTPGQLEQYKLLSDSDKQAYLDQIKKVPATTGVTTDMKGKALGDLPYTAAGDIASTVIDNNVKVNPTSQHAQRSEMFKQAGVTGLKRTGQLAAIGANPALMAATSGLSLPIAAALGLAEGVTEGAIKGKKKYNAYTGEQQEVGAGDAAKNQYSLAQGGEVKGPGTGTSDSVKAEIPQGSFIVPKKNAAAAEAIRKSYLNKKSGYMPKHQGDTAVSLSNGEHMYTPEEYTFLKSKGVDIDALAPNAKSGVSGLQDGGPVDPEFKKAYDAATKTATSQIDPKVADLVKQYADAETLEEVTKIRAQLKALGYNTDGTPVTGTSTPSVATVATDTPAVTDTADSAKPKTAAEKVFAGLGGYAGLGAILQTGIGVAQVAGKKPPVDTIDPQLVKQRQEALDDAKTGLSDPETALVKNTIESNRRANIYSIQNASGGDAGLAIANSRSANLGANQSILELAAKDAEVKATKQARADALTLNVASAKRQLFEDKQSMFSKNMEVGSNLMLNGINNFFGNLRYQDYLRQADKRKQDSEINFSSFGQ